MFIRNAWYVAAWSHEVGADAVFRRVLLDRPVVLFRDREGALHALLDRCPHRHAPLSDGRNEGDGLRCLYHGVKFDPRGRCIEIPGQATPAPGLEVQSFPIVERDRLAWIWMGDPALAAAAEVPALPWLDDPRWGKQPGYLHYRANYQLIVDNLLDLSHLAWVHAKTLGNAKQASLRPTVETRDGVVHVSRWSVGDDPAPFHARVGRFTGKVDRWNLCEWRPPGLFLMDAGVAPTGSGAPEGNRTGAIQFQHLSAQTPETERTTHYFFAHAHDFQPDDAEVSRRVYDEVMAGFEEDRAVIEGQQANIELDPDARMRGIVHDLALNQGRFLIERLLRAEAAGAERVTA